MRHILAAACLVLVSSLAQAAYPTTSWVELAPDQQIAVRTVTSDACPDVVVDGQTRPMSERAAPDSNFTFRTCSLLLPRSVRNISQNGDKLPVPGAINRIVVIGDTGCRSKIFRIAILSGHLRRMLVWPPRRIPIL